MEKDLFGPIKEYFEGFGYVCDGEVEDIDLYMEKDGESVAVELKQTLDFKAVQQAALRQKVADTVFIGIFRPRDMHSGSFRDKLYLLKRLGIGLIVVSKTTGALEIKNEPNIIELASFRSRNKKKKEILQSEFQKRKVKNNVGGVNGKKLITSYREDALLVLDALSELGGAASPKQVKELSKIEKAGSILQKNYYGWFEHAEKGLYRIREEGYAALEEFEETLYILKRGAMQKG